MYRRNFLKVSGLGSIATLVPGNIMATSLAPLYTGEMNPGSEYTLLRIEQVFPEYSFPYIGEFDTDRFKLRYKLYNFYADFVKDAGTFEIERSGGNNPEFSVVSRREAAADVITELNDTYAPDFMGRYIFEGKIKTRNDLLATPLSWSCGTKITRGGNEEAYLNTEHKWTGSYMNGWIGYESGAYRKEKQRIEGELSWKWGLIHLVQQMAEQSIQEIHFSALDELDMVYEHQYARFRKKQMVDVGRGEVVFTVIDVLGDGVIPTVYWIDQHHRVTFIITGVEAYLIA